MKLNNTFFIALFINVLSLGSQLLCQEVPEVTYYSHIAPLAQYAAQIIAPCLDESYKVSAIEDQFCKNSSAFVYLSNTKKTLQYKYINNKSTWVPTPESCIDQDNSGALSYCLKQTLAKKTGYLKKLTNYALTHNAYFCLRMLLDHVDSPRKLNIKQLLLDRVKKGYTKGVNVLVPYCDISDKDDLLLEALKYGHASCADILLYNENKNNLSKNDLMKKLPTEELLLHALESGYAGCADILLSNENKNNLSKNDLMKKLPTEELLLHALESGYAGCADILLSNENKNNLSKNDLMKKLPTKELFTKAIENGYAGCVQILSPYNNPCIVYKDYYPPIERAFVGLTKACDKKSYEDTISFLITTIPGIIEHVEGESVLIMAIRLYAPISLIRRIIASDKTHSLINRKHVDRDNHDSMTPLNYAIDRAIKGGDDQIVELLLAEGSDPNFGLNWNPLALSIKKQRPDLVHLLVQAGSKLTERMFTQAINQLEEHRESAAAYKTLTILVPKGKEFFTNRTLLRDLISTMSVIKNLDTLPLLKDLGKYLHIDEHIGIRGEGPLHIAARCSNENMVKALIEAGCNTEATDVDGKTPLHFAAEYEHQTDQRIATTIAPCMKQLILAKVALDKTDAHGNTALHIAALYGNFRGILLLLEHNANPEIKNNSKETAYDIAMPTAKATLGAYALGKKRSTSTRDQNMLPLQQ